MMVVLAVLYALVSLAIMIISALFTDMSEGETFALCVLWPVVLALFIVCLPFLLLYEKVKA